MKKIKLIGDGGRKLSQIKKRAEEVLNDIKQYSTNEILAKELALYISNLSQVKSQSSPYGYWGDITPCEFFIPTSNTSKEQIRDILKSTFKDLSVSYTHLELIDLINSI